MYNPSEEDAFDAVLSTIMNEYIDQEAEKYQQICDAIKDDPSYDVPPGLGKRVKKQLKKEMSTSKTGLGIKTLRFLGRCVLAAIVVVLLLGVTFAISPIVRTTTLNVLMTVDEKLATWSLTGSDRGAIIVQDMTVEAGWIPEGYTRCPLKQLDENDWFLEYDNSQGQAIRILLSIGGNNDHVLDVEDATSIQKTIINGSNAVLSEKNGLKRVAWVMPDCPILVSVMTDSLNDNDLIRLCCNLRVSIEGT